MEQHSCATTMQSAGPATSVRAGSLFLRGRAACWQVPSARKGPVYAIKRAGLASSKIITDAKKRRPTMSKTSDGINNYRKSILKKR